MKSKKNVLVSLSVFIAIVLVFTLFGQKGKPFKVFPPPAYDSGWIAYDKGSFITLMHNLGGDPDNYLVDIGYLSENPNAPPGQTGRHNHWHTYCGASWHDLTDAEIRVKCWNYTNYIDYFRIRIWIYEEN